MSSPGTPCSRHGHQSPRSGSAPPTTRTDSATPPRVARLGPCPAVCPAVANRPAVGSPSRPATRPVLRAASWRRSFPTAAPAARCPIGPLITTRKRLPAALSCEPGKVTVRFPALPGARPIKNVEAAWICAVFNRSFRGTGQAPFSRTTRCGTFRPAAVLCAVCDAAARETAAFFERSPANWP